MPTSSVMRASKSGVGGTTATAVPTGIGAGDPECPGGLLPVSTGGVYLCWGACWCYRGWSRRGRGNGCSRGQRARWDEFVGWYWGPGMLRPRRCWYGFGDVVRS